jgi:hypothetical protein
MAPSRAVTLVLTIATALTLALSAAAGAVVIESTSARATVTGSAMTVFTDATTRIQIRCRHSITIPTTAFSGTASVSIEAANNTYTNCSASDGATCTVRVNGRWTLTASTTRSGSIRIESTVTVDCTNVITAPPYSCVFTVQTGQTLSATFTNPVFPSVQGSLRVDTPNNVRYMVDSERDCPLGGVGTIGTATMAETMTTQNVRIVP